MNCGLGAWAVSRGGGKGNTIGVLGSVGTNSPRDNGHFPVATACPFTISCRAGVARRWVCTSSAQCCFLPNKTRLFPIPKTTQARSSLYTASFSHKRSFSLARSKSARRSLTSLSHTPMGVGLSATRPEIGEIGWGCRDQTRPRFSLHQCCRSPRYSGPRCY